MEEDSSPDQKYQYSRRQQTNPNYEQIRRHDGQDPNTKRDDLDRIKKLF